MTSQNTLTATMPTGLLRAVLRLPIVLYRLNLGWLLGGLSSFLNGLIAFASGYYLDVLLNAFYIGISLLSFWGWAIKEHTFQSMSWKKASIWLLVPGLLAAMYHPMVLPPFIV